MKLRKVALALVFSILIAAPIASAAAPATKKSNTSPSTPQASVGGSVQGYASSAALQYGTIVQLAKNSTKQVLPATQKNAQQMYGVTVDPQQLSLTISDSSLKNEVYVATSGTYNVLVSNQAGAINSGDYIAMSSIDGVGMDAGNSGTTVLGRAAASFDGKSNVAIKTELKDTASNTTKAISIGIIPVAINIQHNPDEQSTMANLPKALERVGQAVADKHVSTVKIYLSVAITVLSLIVALVILYAGIRSGLIAIGRNPLSKKTVFRGILQTVITGILILIIGLFAVYLLLKM